MRFGSFSRSKDFYAGAISVFRRDPCNVPLDARPRPEGVRLLVGLQAWARLGSALMASYGDILAHFPLAERICSFSHAVVYCGAPRGEWRHLPPALGSDSWRVGRQSPRQQVAC